MQDATVTLSSPASGSLPPTREGGASAISWPSIIGGALATLAVSVIFVTFGGALGLMPSSPPDSDRTMMMITSAAAIWLIVTQWLASAVGGYLTGRLRTKWVSTHTHEVFFRDTAHGFLSWSVALLIGIGLLSSTVGSVMGHGEMGKSGMHAAGAMADSGGPSAYYVDSLYRINHGTGGTAQASEAISTGSAVEGVPVSGTEPAPSAGASQPNTSSMVNPGSVSSDRVNPELRAETSRILMRGAAHDGLSDEDKTYLAQLVASHTRMSLTEATKRVDSVTAQASSDAQKLHKAIGYISLFTALAMLIGAFISSAAAALGGSQRDEWEESVRTGTYVSR